MSDTATEPESQPIFLTDHGHRSVQVGESAQGVPAGFTSEAFRGSGPGGQKRNKTSSAVRVVHVASGLSTVADDTRSQPDNRKLALARVRLLVTVRCRKRVFLDRLEVPAGYSAELLGVSPKHPMYLEMLGHCLDVLHATGYILREAATHLGTSTAPLSNFVTSEPLALTELNSQRRRRGLKALAARQT